MSFKDTNSHIDNVKDGVKRLEGQVDVIDGKATKAS